MFNRVLFPNFPASKERTFLQYYRKKTVKQASFSIFCGLFLFSIFAFLDPWIIPEIRNIAWALRFILVFPFGTFVLIFINISKKDYYIQCFISFLVLLGASLIQAMIILSRGSGKELYYAGLVLVIFVGYVFFKLRFVFACICGWLIFLLYAVSSIVVGTRIYIIINNLFFLGGANFIGMFTAYILETSLRKEYLQNIQLKKINRQLLISSNSDGLTGVANRRFFDKRIFIEWNRCKRIGQPISVIMFDVDYFKAFNDAMGHQAGDSCLRSVSDIIRQNTRRASDFIARYGGEEFVAILAYTDLPAATAMANRIRAAVENAKIPHPASKAGQFVTVSAGVGSANPTGTNFSYLRVVEAADAALYEAKSKGRNCVESKKI